MFKFFKKPQGSILVFKIKGMHCTSCSLNIDMELEDTEGVISAITSYAKATTIIEFNEKVVTKKKLQEVIESLGYSIE